MFLDLLRAPDSVRIVTEDGTQTLASSGEESWQGTGGLAVSTAVRDGRLAVTLAAPSAGVLRLHLRWRGDLSGVRSWMGDAWERAYGDLEWRGIVPERQMPWYCAGWDGAQTNGYGVRTSCNAFCFWQADAEGLSLWAEVKSGGVGLRLGSRVLEVCDVVCREGSAGETPFAALHAFCRQMCPNPRMPEQPVYGCNDWYYCYGNNSAEQTMADCRRTVALSPAGSNRPFVVIDDGWRVSTDGEDAPWDRSNETFPNLAQLAEEIRQAGARPGIWIRPLAPAASQQFGRSSRDSRYFDPSVPEVLELVRADIARLREWGFELIKHDYTTWDLLGLWGFEMGASTTSDGWEFAGGRGRTTAEVILDLYRTIRQGAGEALVLGCDTVSHLSAGLFELYRIGDDTSGRNWERTRKMGVNSLAFRAAQHGTFYAVDADCVGLTRKIPWEMNRQWLDLLARSGTMLFVSANPEAIGPEQEQALRAAYAQAALEQPLAEPMDWLQTNSPSRWRLADEEVRYDWIGGEGASPIVGD